METAERIPYIFVDPPVETQRSSYHLYQVLRSTFTVLPLLAGADKFFHCLTNWDQYLAAPLVRLIPLDPHVFMEVVGGIELYLGVLVAVVPRIGAFVVAGGLCCVTANLLLLPGHEPAAVLNAGLALGALALGLLARSQRGPLRPKFPPAA
ncbi:MAG TPA: hypothetical protein VMU54_00095 [Planctomycetota bacterium]|nr:hypothetical protein [Planctomycetota bacterium]